MTLAVERGPAFAGRVPIEVRNLPAGRPGPEHRPERRARDRDADRADGLPLRRALGRADGAAVLRRRQGRGGGRPSTARRRSSWSCGPGVRADVRPRPVGADGRASVMRRSAEVAPAATAPHRRRLSVAAREAIAGRPAATGTGTRSSGSSAAIVAGLGRRAPSASTWPSGASNPGVRHLGRVVLERLGHALQRAWTTPPKTALGPALRDGPARDRGRPGRPVHRDRGVGPGRAPTAEARRGELRDGRPPGPLQLGPARARLDPRGPQQDHPGQAARRHHPRQPRGDRPARQAGRPGVQRRLHRQGRPDQRGHPPPRPGPTRPLGRRPDRRPPGGARRRQDDPDLHRDPQHLPGRPAARTSPSSAATRTTATTCSRPAPTRSSRPTSWASGSWPARRSTTA